jgi:hypothetical protein
VAATTHPVAPADSAGEWLSLAEAGELLGVSYYAVRRWQRAGALPSRRVPYAGGGSPTMIEVWVSYSDEEDADDLPESPVAAAQEPQPAPPAARNAWPAAIRNGHAPETDQAPRFGGEDEAGPVWTASGLLYPDPQFETVGERLEAQAAALEAARPVPTVAAPGYTGPTVRLDAAGRLARFRRALASFRALRARQPPPGEVELLRAELAAWRAGAWLWRYKGHGPVALPADTE